MVKGRIKENGDIHMPAGCTVQELYDKQTYKYLGVHKTITRRGGSRIPQKGREGLHRVSGCKNFHPTPQHVGSTQAPLLRPSRSIWKESHAKTGPPDESYPEEA